MSRPIHITVLCFMFLANSCFRGPGFFSPRKGDEVTKSVSITSYGGGIVKGSYDPNMRVPQVFTVPEGDLVGALLSMPPGSLSVAADITIQPGTDVASSSLAEELSLGTNTNLQSIGSTVVVSVSENVDAVKPFHLSIPLPTTRLALTSSQYYVVVYLVKSAASGENRVGIIPTAKIVNTGSKIEFESRFFGAFQIATVDEPVTEEISVKTDRNIVTKQAVEGLALSVDQVSPFVAANNESITLTGKNFRESMTVAIGDKSISQLDVISDVKATFKMPSSKFGPTKIKILQDGIKETGQLFALADKTGLPLITMDPASVCSGLTYYDITGTSQEGTKSCSSGSSGTTNGGSIAASSTLSLGSTVASHYTVTGSGTSISAISTAEVGTKVTLYFDGSVRLVHSSSLQLPKQTSFWTQQGDVALLVATSSSQWRVITLSATHDASFVGTLTSTLVQPADGTTSSILQWTASTDDQSNYSSGRFTAAKAGFYQVGYSISATYSGGYDPYMSYIYLYRNGNMSNSYSLSCSAGTCSGSQSLNSSSPVFLGQGDYLEFKIQVYNTTGTPNVTFSSGASNAVSVKLINENQ